MQVFIFSDYWFFSLPYCNWRFYTIQIFRIFFSRYRENSQLKNKSADYVIIKLFTALQWCHYIIVYNGNMQHFLLFLNLSEQLLLLNLHFSVPSCVSVQPHTSYGCQQRLALSAGSSPRLPRWQQDGVTQGCRSFATDDGFGRLVRSSGLWHWDNICWHKQTMMHNNSAHEWENVSKPWSKVTSWISYCS